MTLTLGYFCLIRTFDVLVCPALSATEAFPVAAARLWNSLPSHVTAVVLNHISSHFLIPLADYSLSHSDLTFLTFYMLTRAGSLKQDPRRSANCARTVLVRVSVNAASHSGESGTPTPSHGRVKSRRIADARWRSTERRPGSGREYLLLAAAAAASSLSPSLMIVDDRIVIPTRRHTQMPTAFYAADRAVHES